MLNRTDISFISIILGFCWIKTLPAHSDHCRAVGSRVWDDIGPWSSGRHPGEPIPVRAGSVPKAHGLVRTTPASSGHLIPGCDTRSANYPVDDVSQAWITLHGASGLGMAFGEDKKTGRLLSPESTPKH